MAVVFTPDGWIKWIGAYVRQAKTVRLVGPDGELSDSKYLPHTLTGADWRIEMRGAGIVSAAYPEVFWRFSEPKQVVGYEVLDADGTVLWKEKFPTFERAVKVDMQSVELVVEMDTEG